MPSTKTLNRKHTLQAIQQVQQLSTLFAKRRSQLAKGVGLTDAQWRILEGVSSEHFMPSMFARDHNQTPGAVSKITRQLLEKRLIRVSICASDGRHRQYALTARGQRTIERLRRAREQAISDIWEDLPPDDLSNFTRIAEELIARICRYADTRDRSGLPHQRKPASPTGTGSG